MYILLKIGRGMLRKLKEKYNFKKTKKQYNCKEIFRKIGGTWEVYEGLGLSIYAYARKSRCVTQIKIELEKVLSVITFIACY